MALDYILVN